MYSNPSQFEMQVPTPPHNLEDLLYEMQVGHLFLKKQQPTLHNLLSSDQGRCDQLQC